MCSGPFKLDSWKTGQGVKMVPNPDYWDTTLPTPKVTSLTVIGVPGRRDPDRRPQDRRRSTALRHRPAAPSASSRTTGGQRLPGRAVRHRLDGDQRHQGPAVDARGAARRCPRRSTARASSTPSTRARAASRTPLRRAGTWGYADERLRRGLRRAAAAGPGPGQGQGGRQGGGIVGQTDHDRHVVGHPEPQHRDPGGQGGRRGDRPEGEAEEREPVELHQLLHRPEGLRLGRHVHRPTNYGDYADPAALYNTLRACRVARRTSTAGATRRSPRA